MPIGLRIAIVLATLGLVLAGCSPEASRARGSGLGADVGNHGSPIRLHERNDPAFKEPIVGQAVRR